MKIAEKSFGGLRVFMFVTLNHFDLDFNMAMAIAFTIADPDMSQLLPVFAIFVNREPRACHKVHALESQSTPDVI